jgi:c-di-GMP-binding flagellar brake protein YcgR
MAERRNFVRLKKRIKVLYKVIIDRFSSPKAPSNVSFTETLSGNGMTLLSPTPANKGTKYEMNIEIPDGKERGIDVVGEVIGYNIVGNNQYEIRIKFIEIEEMARDRLMKYILKEDLKIKKAQKKNRVKSNEK